MMPEFFLSPMFIVSIFLVQMAIVVHVGAFQLRGRIFVIGSMLAMAALTIAMLARWQDDPAQPLSGGVVAMHWTAFALAVAAVLFHLSGILRRSQADAS